MAICVYLLHFEKCVIAWISPAEYQCKMAVRIDMERSRRFISWQPTDRRRDVCWQLTVMNTIKHHHVWVYILISPIKRIKIVCKAKAFVVRLQCLLKLKTLKCHYRASMLWHRGCVEKTGAQSQWAANCKSYNAARSLSFLFTGEKGKKASKTEWRKKIWWQITSIMKSLPMQLL